jgi:hypothetical protein
MHWHGPAGATPTLYIADPQQHAIRAWAGGMTLLTVAGWAVGDEESFVSPRFGQAGRGVEGQVLGLSLVLLGQGSRGSMATRSPRRRSCTRRWA